MTTVSTAQLTPPVSKRDHTVGSASAAITLVEYGDDECPHCGAAHPIVQEVRRLGNGKADYRWAKSVATQKALA